VYADESYVIDAEILKTLLTPQVQNPGKYAADPRETAASATDGVDGGSGGGGFMTS